MKICPFHKHSLDLNQLKIKQQKIKQGKMMQSVSFHNNERRSHPLCEQYRRSYKLENVQLKVIAPDKTS